MWRRVRYGRFVVHFPSLRTVVFLTLTLLLAGCSIKKYAINTVGDALAEGNSVYETDEDIELVGEALPFGLKLVESLLQESPYHRGLLLTAARGFVLYSYAYVDYPAQVAADEDIGKARKLRTCSRLRLAGNGDFLSGTGDAAHSGSCSRGQRDPQPQEEAAGLALSLLDGGGARIGDFGVQE